MHRCIGDLRFAICYLPICFWELRARLAAHGCKGPPDGLTGLNLNRLPHKKMKVFSYFRYPPNPCAMS
jgi:hypothetical protein